MLPLHDFIGSREASMPSFGFQQPVDQSIGKNERKQAILEKLATSHNMNSMSVDGTSQDRGSPRRQEIGNQQRVALPSVKTYNQSSRSSNLGARWQDQRSHVFAERTTSRLPATKLKSVEGFDEQQDAFGTDLENFDDTVTSSNISNARNPTNELAFDKYVASFDSIVSSPN